MSGCRGISVHGGTDQVRAGLKGSLCLLQGGAVRHDDDIRVFFLYRLQEFRRGQPVAALRVRAVDGNDVRQRFHALVHFPHGHGDPSGIARIFPLDQADHRKAGLFLNADNIPDGTGPDHLCPGKLCRPGHQRHDGAFRIIQRFAGRRLAGNDDGSLH